MLARKMYERRNRDLDRLTVAVANAVGMAMGGEKAQTAWKRSRDIPDVPADVAVDNPAAAAQAATIGRLRALYNAQKPNSGLRNAIRAKKPD